MWRLWFPSLVWASLASAHGLGPPRADRVVVAPGSITVEQRVTLDEGEATRLREQLAGAPDTDATVAALLEARLQSLRVRADGAELPLVLVDRRVDVGPPGFGLLLSRRASIPAGARVLIDDRDKDPRISVVTEVALDQVTLRSALPRPALLFADHPLALWLAR